MLRAFRNETKRNERSLLVENVCSTEDSVRNKLKHRIGVAKNGRHALFGQVLTNPELRNEASDNAHERNFTGLQNIRRKKKTC